MQGAGYKEHLIDPLLLITDTQKYYKAKQENNSDYKNLCDIIHKMKQLYSSGDYKYNAFGNFLREVEDEGFDINDLKPYEITDKEKLNNQIELIRMLMCFKYCPDE